MGHAGEYDYVIESRDMDHTGRVRFTALCHYILETAGTDADNNGFGVRDLNKGHCSWVLSRMAIETGEELRQGDRITVRTWVNEVSRMMTTRNMTITTADGRVAASAVTQWAIIDIAERTPQDIRALMDYSAALCLDPSPIDKPEKIRHDASQIVKEHKVVYSDIDFNNHVNSMKYIEWMLDMPEQETIDGNKIVRADINFIHEALLGQTVLVALDEGESPLFGIHESDGTALCRAQFRLQPRK
jgi:acyl-ACP thioesterase